MDFPINFRVAGIVYQDESGELNRDRIKHLKYVRYGSKFLLEREPDNEHDPNAIAIKLPVRKGQVNLMIGYIPRKIAAQIAPLIDSGEVDLKASFRYKPMNDETGEPQGLIMKLSKEGD